ncbi:hypothetical protein ACSQ67_002960 [Phaseolus vulgaris]
MKINMQTFFSRKCKYQSFYIWLLKVIGLLGLVVLCLWLALRPKSPSYSIVSISVEQPSNSNGNGTISYSLEVENSNKDSSIYYDDTVLSFLYGEQEDEVGQTTIGAFHQEGSNTKDVSNTVNAKPRPMKPLMNAISNATTELKVALMTRYRYKTWGIKSQFHGLHLKGILPIESNGKLSGKNKKYPLHRNSNKLGSRSKDSSPEFDIYWQLVYAIGELRPVSWKATVVPRLFDVLGDKTCCSKPNLQMLCNQIFLLNPELPISQK